MQRWPKRLQKLSRFRGSGLFGRVGFALLVATLLVTTVGAEEDGALPTGPELYKEHKCYLCHSVDVAGIEAKTKSAKMAGPDVSGYTTDDVAALASYLRKQGEREGVAHKREFEGTDEELQTILDWLGSLEAVDTQAAAETADGR